MITLDVKLKRVHYNINVNSKLTIIEDMSATGKTTLLQDIKTCLKAGEGLTCDLNVSVIDNRYDFDKVKVKSLILMDEDANILSDDEDYLYSKIKESPHYFIIVSRETKFDELPYSIDDIKRLYTSHCITKLINRYPKNFYKNFSFKNIDFCFVEDSTTGLKFFEKIFGEPNCDSTHGKDNYNLVFKRKDNVLFVLDRIGFGSCVKSFLEEFVNYRNVSLMDYESLEWLLLSYLGIDTSLPDNVYNKADCYTHKLSEHLSQYGKTLECPCLKNCKCKKCTFSHSLYDSRAVVSKVLGVDLC